MRCCSCHRSFRSSLLGMHVECALMATTREEGQQHQSIQHITHPHPLLLHDAGDELKCCYLCRSELSGDEAYYGCAHCKYFLHKSCADFPLEFSPHPLHPHHSSLSLFADYSYSAAFTCNICDIYRYQQRFYFKCDDHQCSFRICWKCIISVKKKNIKYEDHEHLLCFVDEARQIDQCNAYDAYCTRPDLINIVGNSEEFKRTKSSIFRCLDCDFRLHFLCGPLPSTIKHDCHIHSLTLLDSLIEDDFGEYYCDVCETQRDPRIRLYHCNDCKYFVHLHCIISEIVKVVRGDLEGVELKAFGNDYWRSQPTEYETTSLTLMDLIHQMTEDEKETLKYFYKWDDTSSSKVNVGIVPPKQRDDEEINKILQLSRFNATSFEALLHEFGESLRFEKSELKCSDLGLKMVKVKGYMIPYPLAGVLQTLLDEYGDISSDCYRSIEKKSFGYFILCQVVKRMRATLVKDVTEHLLREWYCHLFCVKWYMFKIGFARVQFGRVVDAYLGLQAETLKDEIPKILNAKKDVLQRKIAEIQRGLDKCNEYQGSSQKSEYMRYCQEKASKSRWLYSFDCSIKDDAESSAIPRSPH